MRKAFSPVHLLFILLASCLLSTYFLYLGQISRFTIRDHSFQMPVGSFLALIFFLFLLLSSMWALSSRVTAQAYAVDESQALSRNLWAYSPVFFLLLLPAAASFFLSAGDLYARFAVFGIALIFAFVYLQYANLSVLGRENSRPFSLIPRKFFLLPTKKQLLILFIVALLAYSLGSVLMLSEGITLSGDEPHYMIISQSLLQDGDFDLSNNYASHDYRQYMPPTTRLSPHVAPRTQGRYSFHSPGLSVLLFPFFTVGSFFGGKLQLFIVRFGMSIFGALLGLQVFLYAFQEWKQEKLALGLWAVFSFTTPVFFHSLHIYPEIVITLFSLTIFRWIRFSRSISSYSLLGMGLMLSLFIWLHAVKYTLVLIPLSIYCVWELLRKHRIGWRLLIFLAFPFCLTLLHLYFSKSLYGSYSIFSVSLEGATSAGESTAYLRSLVSAFPLRARLESLAGYFFDQRDGLLLYAPIYFFAFLGMKEMFRRNRKGLLTLLSLTAPYVLFHAILTQRTSFAPQARVLVAVFWVMAVFLGYFFAYNRKRLFSRMAYLTAAVSYLVVYLLLRTPWALYQPTTADQTERAGRLFAGLGNIQFFPPDFLPSYLKIYDSHWIPNYVWLGVFLVFMASYSLWKRHDTVPRFSKHLAFCGVGLCIFFSWFVLYPRFTLLYPVNTTFPSQEKITFYALGQVVRMTEPGQFLIPADGREYVFHFTSWREMNEIRLDFGSLEGDYYVEVRLFDLELFRGETSREIKTLTLSQPEFYAHRQTHLYRVSVYLERRSSVSISRHPFRFSITPKS
ncbi:hypothetical protein ACFLR7_01955 [Acidobacteriota bacterium]